MSPRQTELRLFALFLVTALAAAVNALPCTERAETNVVYVAFDGCGAAEPGLQFDVMIGDETVTVKKAKATDKFWVGETGRNFAVRDRTLTLLDDAVPRARASCMTKAAPHRDGTCVALYRVSCEPFWQLTVETVPKNARATIRYERKKAPTAVPACPAQEPETSGLVGREALVLSRSESLLLEVAKAPLRVQIPLSLTAFAGMRKELRIRDVQVRRVSSGAPIQHTEALAAMGKAELKKIVTDMRFIRSLSPEGEEE